MRRGRGLWTGRWGRGLPRSSLFLPLPSPVRGGALRGLVGQELPFQARGGAARRGGAAVGSWGPAGWAATLRAARAAILAVSGVTPAAGARPPGGRRRAAPARPPTSVSVARLGLLLPKRRPESREGSGAPLMKVRAGADREPPRSRGAASGVGAAGTARSFGGRLGVAAPPLPSPRSRGDFPALGPRCRLGGGAFARNCDPETRRQVPRAGELPSHPLGPPVSPAPRNCEL